MYDLLIRNVEGAKDPDKPNNEWCIDACAIQQLGPDVLNNTRTEFIQMLTQDETINNLRVDKPSHFVKKNNVLFRVLPNNDDVKHVVVPVNIRLKILSVAHDSCFGGHMELKKLTSE